MANIIFHIGSHRTGSTHLQHNLYLNKELLEAHGIKYFRFHDVEQLRPAAIKLRNKVGKGCKLDQDINLIKNKIEEQLKDFDAAIISYEGTLGDINLHHAGGIYPEAERLIKIYEKILKKHTVVPVFVTRDYIDFIFSTYKYEVKNGMSLSLGDYIRDIDLQHNRWTQIINTLDKTFDNKLIWSFEDYKSNYDKILVRLLKIIGKDIDKNQLTIFKGKKNHSTTSELVQLNFTINKIFNRGVLFKNLAKRVCRKINYFVNEKSITVKSKYLLNCYDVNLAVYFDNISREYEAEIQNLEEDKII